MLFKLLTKVEPVSWVALQQSIQQIFQLVTCSCWNAVHVHTEM